MTRKLKRSLKIRERIYDPQSGEGRHFQCPCCGAEVTDAPSEKKPCPKCGTLMLYSGK